MEMSRTVISAGNICTLISTGQTEKQKLVFSCNTTHSSRLYIFMKTNSKNMIEKWRNIVFTWVFIFGEEEQLWDDPFQSHSGTSMTACLSPSYSIITIQHMVSLVYNSMPHLCYWTLETFSLFLSCSLLT